MIWDRERYIAHCQHQFTGREMFCELFGPLHILEQEWRSQGVSEKEIGMTAFDWDYVNQAWLAGNSGAITGIQTITLEDNPEFTLYKDHLGRTAKLCKAAATIALPLDFPVKTMDDWLKIKHWYEFSEDRVDREKLQMQKKLRDQGYLTIIGVPGGFDETRELMGEENLCIAYYEDPELVHDILQTLTDTACKVIDLAGDICPIDNLAIHEDMAGKSGPLAGPAQIREFIAPYYKAVWEAAKSKGAVLFSQDSDGNMNADVDAFMECGVNSFYPNEPAAGMDIVEMKKKYGKKLFYKGGIDKHVLRQDKEAIRKELEYKMCDLMKGGGTVFALDHRIPNGVSIENYRYYVNLGREILDLPPVSEEGWARMAF